MDKAKIANDASASEVDISSQPDTRHKRLVLTFTEHAGLLGTADPTKTSDPAIPQYVQQLLRCFSAAHLELACVPRTTEIDTFLATFFAHEYIQTHNRHNVQAPTQAALVLVQAAAIVHRTALYNSRQAEDASAWYPIVQRLLSARYDGKFLPTLPSTETPLDEEDDFIQTVYATGKTVTALLQPAVDVKLDVLVVFNGLRDPIMCKALGNQIWINVFSDGTLAGKIVALACVVSASQAEAEYRLGVFGMKTLSLTRQLAREKARNSRVEWRTATDVAVGISVCGHVWSLHVTYLSDDAVMVTHGPVFIGSTDTLVGTLKIAKWVCRFRMWAEADAWDAWRALLKNRMA